MDGTSARAVLGLAPAASRHDIKRAFRARAKQTHPDAGGTAGEFARLTKAYEAALVSSGSAASDRFLRAADLTTVSPRWAERPTRRSAPDPSTASTTPSFEELLAAAMAA